MNTIIIIVIILIAIYLLYNYINRETVNDVQKNTTSSSNEEFKQEDTIYTDEYGRKYKETSVTSKIPRKSYILGSLSGKYRGEIDLEKENQFINSKFFNFTIYEANISNGKIRKNDDGPFIFEEDINFPKENLPTSLPCKFDSKELDKEFGIVLYEPKLKNICFDKKHHQTDGNEIFGLITADITGYILDFISETHIERNYVLYESEPLDEKEEKKIIYVDPEIKQTEVLKTTTPTGKVEYKGNYLRYEYYYSNYSNKYWGNWKFHQSYKSENQDGCISSFLWILAFIFGIPFLLLLLPQLAYLIPILLISLLGLIPSGVWKWIFRILIGLLLLFFTLSILTFVMNKRNSDCSNMPIVTDIPKETTPKTEPILDSVGNSTNDSIIVHYREWKDYDGNQYSGNVWIKTSDCLKSQNFKRNLSISENSPLGYDNMLYELKENDKNTLNGIYQLFDSLKKVNAPSREKFAEMLVSFVQDIPYTIILPEGCDPSLYTDNYIKSYLNSANASCDGYQKFGINSPAEFMASLKGDCDTRSLFLYTVLSHYKYDVALLSSEQYSHSILGINLNYSGKAYTYKNQRYVFWETTAANIKPGILSKEISNINYWRISLKSK